MEISDSKRGCSRRSASPDDINSTNQDDALAPKNELKFLLHPIESPPPIISTTSTPKTIHNLSDKELFTILDSLALLDLMRSELVCKRWHWMHALVCASKRALILCVPSRMYEPANYRDITRFWFFTDFRVHRRIEDLYLPLVGSKFDITSEELVIYLVTKFPNITDLSLFFVDNLPIESFLLLTRFYRTQLVRLALFGSEELKRNYEHDGRFWKRIKSLKELKHLAVPFDDDLISNAEALYDVFPRLNSFYNKGSLQRTHPSARSDYEMAEKSSEATTTTNTTTTTKLNTSNIFAVETRKGSMCFNATFLDSRIPTFPRVGFYSFDQDSLDDTILKCAFKLRYIITRHPTVVYLDMGLAPMVELVRFLPMVAQLKQLTVLRLVCQQKGCKLLDDLTLSNYKVMLSPTLPNIKSLILFNFSISHSTHFLFIRHLFPCIESIHFEHCSLVHNWHWLADWLGSFEKLVDVLMDNRLLVKLSAGRIEAGGEELVAEKRRDELALLRQLCQNAPSLVKKPKKFDERKWILE